MDNAKFLRMLLNLAGLVLLMALVAMTFSRAEKAQPRGPGCTCAPPCECKDCPGSCGPCLRPPNRL